MMRSSLIVVALTAAAVGSLTAQIPSFVTTPQLTIGDSAGDPTMVFNRLSDARRLSDGRIVAAVCGDRQLRSFDASGKYLTTLNLAEPQAPQRILARLFPAGGDTLAVNEGLNLRLTLIAPDLSVLRVIPVPNPLPPPTNGRPARNTMDVIGRFANGTFVGRVQAGASSDTGALRRKISFFRFDESGKILDSVAGLPGNEIVVIPGQPITGSMRLGRTTVAALLPDRLVIGDQAVADLAEYAPDMKLRRQIPTITKPVQVTDSMQAAWTSTANARANFPVNGVGAVFGNRFADALPAFRDLVSGTDGRIWAQDPAGADSYPLVWTAYQDARPVARAELPPRFYPTQFGRDWVLGLAFDTTKVERVQLLHLTTGTLSDRRLTPREAAPPNRPQCGAWTSR
jgi:hypothetical protein